MNRRLLQTIILLLACTWIQVLSAQTLLHYWNFNDSGSEETLLTPSLSLVNGASLVHVPGGLSAIQTTSNTDQGFPVANLNARNGDEAGTHLRFNDPIGGTLELHIPTTGYRDPVVRYATRRSGSGAGTQILEYSLNGSDWILFGEIFPNNGDPTLQEIDLSNLPGSDNNANLKVRITFTQGSGGTVGNNRFDNLTVDADPIPAPTLVHYWNFNDNSFLDALLQPTVSLVTGASISHLTGGISEIVLTGTGQNFDVENLNARNGDPAGTHLRFNDPLGGGLRFDLPTTGYTDPVVRFSTRRSSSGAGLQYWEHTTDGTNWNPFDTIAPDNGDPGLVTFDFAGMTEADDNALFALRVSFDVGSGGSAGNNRFDNLTLDATGQGGDVTPPVATLDPKDGGMNIAVSVTPRISFNEEVRKADGTPILDTDLPSLVVFRKDGPSGTDVPFSGSYTDKAITLTPTLPLEHSQVYYFAIQPGSFADASGNILQSAAESGFTTISLQTDLQPGDIVPVAYRMNATNTEDEVALLTLVNILPGTLIQMTDAKFTTNPQPQCPGGFTWTSPTTTIPAGTVITIQNDAGTASHGTISGSTFGLSSGGDQFIVYTGTASNPNHISALSSNAWVTATPFTSCSGSNSLLPSALAEGSSAISLATAVGNVSGNTANAYYNGPQEGDYATLRTAILDPANWVGLESGTPPQVWPSWNFPGPPAVASARVSSTTTIQVAFTRDLNEMSATDTLNYQGIPGLTEVTMTSNAAEKDTVTLVFDEPFVNGAAYTLTIRDIMDSQGVPMAGEYVFEFIYQTRVGFVGRYAVLPESAGNAEIRLQVENPSKAMVSLVWRDKPWSSGSTDDIVFAPLMVTLDAPEITITVPLVDDTEPEQDEYLVMAMENPMGATLTGEEHYTIYLLDDDRQAPSKEESIRLEFKGRYTVDNPEEVIGLAEITAYEPGSKRLFSMSTGLKRLHIVDFSVPSLPQLLQEIDLSPYGSGVNSVATQNGIVAVAMDGLPTPQDSGSVLFFTVDGQLLNQVKVGPMPDMVTFTPDGKWVLTANEGEPNDSYSIDPEGSISAIDIQGGIPSVVQAQVTLLGFQAFNNEVDALKASGYRLLKSTSTLAQDAEPEFIAVSADSRTAWVTLQENNAVAVVDLEDPKVTAIVPLGTKDYMEFGNGLDLSDQNPEIVIANWPLQGFFIPDGIASFEVDGETFLVTANEGDEKELSGLNERTTVGAAMLDPTAFPNSAMLKENHAMGRMRISNLHGDADGDGDMDALFGVGTRSFTIWNAGTGELVWDSGDALEQITAEDPQTASLFNADHESNARKGRSRSKGPEPEGVAIGKINDRTYAFIGLERIGGVMTFDISDPEDPRFVDYINTRTAPAYGGDNGTEGILFIPGTESPDGKPYVVSSNEVSGTVVVFEVEIPSVSIDPPIVSDKPAFYPNPSNGMVWFRQPTRVELLDAHGRPLQSWDQALSIHLGNLVPGMYLLRFEDGRTEPLLFQKP